VCKQYKLADAMREKKRAVNNLTFYRHAENRAKYGDTGQAFKQIVHQTVRQATGHTNLTSIGSLGRICGDASTRE